MTMPPLGKVEAFFIIEVCFATPSENYHYYSVYFLVVYF